MNKQLYDDGFADAKAGRVSLPSQLFESSADYYEYSRGYKAGTPQPRGDLFNEDGPKSTLPRLDIDSFSPSGSGVITPCSGTRSVYYSNVDFLDDYEICLCCGQIIVK